MNNLEIKSCCKKWLPVQFPNPVNIFFALNFIAAILDLITTGKANKLFTVGIKKTDIKDSP